MTGSRAAASWTPYDGVEVTGWPLGTIVRGRRVMWDGEIIGARARPAHCFHRSTASRYSGQQGEPHGCRHFAPFRRARPTRARRSISSTLAEADLGGRRCHRRRRAFDGQLQGRSRDHRQGADHPQIPAHSRHRFRRHRHRTRPIAASSRATGSSSMAGVSGEDHHGGYADAGACAGRLAGAAPRQHDDRRCHGGRHRRLYRDAVRHGARAA